MSHGSKFVGLGHKGMMNAVRAAVESWWAAPHPARPLSPSLKLESLENRLLLSATLDTQGLLTIDRVVGTSAVTVSVNPDDSTQLVVSDGAQTTTYAYDSVQQIVIHGAKRAHSITIDPSVDIPATIHSGRGHDTLVAGAGDEQWLIGCGNDMLNAGSGNDTVYCGAGADQVLGGSGNLTVYRGSGQDMINSDSSRTTILGSSGNDYVNTGRAGMAQTNYQMVSAAGTNTWAEGYTPAQIRNAYDFGAVDSTSNLGQGQTIVIVDAFDDPSARADLATFSQEFGLPAPTSSNFQVVYASGQEPAVNADWAVETSLDVQWAHAIAPDAKIVLVEADSDLEYDLLPAVQVGAKIAAAAGGGVLSMSFGANADPSDWAWATQWEQMVQNYPTVSFIEAAGDYGPTFSYEAAAENVTTVGGTDLQIDAQGNQTGPQTVWADSGGGISNVVAVPGYQEGVYCSVNGAEELITQDTTTAGIHNRVMPDVSYSAGAAANAPATGNAIEGFAIYDSIPDQGAAGWQAVEGTSAGCPQWAGLVALANQARAQNRLSVIGGNLNAAIYQIAQLYDGAFTDITSGTTSDGTVAETAGPGFDAASGWGTPVATKFIADMCNPQIGGNIQYISTNINWGATATAPITTQVLPAMTSFNGASGSIAGAASLVLDLPSPSFNITDPGQGVTTGTTGGSGTTTLPILPVTSYGGFDDMTVTVTNLNRRPDGTIYGDGMISYDCWFGTNLNGTAVTSGSAEAGSYVDAVVVDQPIRITGTITTGANGAEHVSGKFYAVDDFGNKIQAGAGSELTGIGTTTSQTSTTLTVDGMPGLWSDIAITGTFKG